MTEISLIVTLKQPFNPIQSKRLNLLYNVPRGDAGGLSREYVLRIPSVSYKATKGHRYIALVADAALNSNLT